MRELWEQGRSLYRLLECGQEGKLVFQTVDLDGTRRSYVRIFAPYQRLILLGGGHISRELCHFGAELGFEVTVVDDRQEFADARRFPEAAQVLCGEFEKMIAKLQITPYDYVAVMTRGHLSDGLCLRALLRGVWPRYAGMVGSSGKVARTMEMLEREGYDPALLKRVEAPIGLKIGSQTPAEIAISILAQLILYRNRKEEPQERRESVQEEEAREKEPQEKRESVQEEEPQEEQEILEYRNSDRELLRYMAQSREAYMLAVVLEKKGSAPVAGGALMAVSRDGIAAGTVGGGLGEYQAAEAARRLLAERRSGMFWSDLTNQDAANEGMICGGTLKIWLQYCENPAVCEAGGEIQKEGRGMAELTHFDQKGNAVMVDVSEKEDTKRTASAVGRIRVSREIMKTVAQGTAKKGDVLGTARIAGIMAVKRTAELIPLCHVLPIHKCSVDFEQYPDQGEILARCTVKTEGKTGVEMEALTGVSAALLTVYDMCKAIDKRMVITDIHLEEKSGGKSGRFCFGARENGQTGLGGDTGQE